MAESYLLTSSYLIEVLFHGSHQGKRVQAKDKGHFSLRGLFQLPLTTPKQQFLPYQPLFAYFLSQIFSLLHGSIVCSYPTPLFLPTHTPKVFVDICCLPLEPQRP